MKMPRGQRLTTIGIYIIAVGVVIQAVGVLGILLGWWDK